MWQAPGDADVRLDYISTPFAPAVTPAAALAGPISSDMAGGAETAPWSLAAAAVAALAAH